MKEKSSKKVVIIHDIASDSIEQAIFILRNAGVTQPPAQETATLVQEAQRIINAYIETMEKSGQKLSQRENKHRKKRGKILWGRVFWALLPPLTFFGALGLYFYFY